MSGHDYSLESIRILAEDLNHVLAKRSDLEERVRFLNTALKMLILASPDNFLVIDHALKAAADSDPREVTYTITTDRSGLVLLEDLRGIR